MEYRLQRWDLKNKIHAESVMLDQISSKFELMVGQSPTQLVFGNTLNLQRIFGDRYESSLV